MQYFQTDRKTLKDYSDNDISNLYSQGFVLTRLGKGEFLQTKSLRINLSQFENSSENRRILNKNDNLSMEVRKLPLEDYSWEIHSLGKEFYTKKFGDGTMSASKIKELFQNQNISNTNFAFEYKESSKIIGYCITYINDEIVHYAYPFYDLDILKERSVGLAMMLKAINWSKENNKKYIYLGSVTDKKSHYKLQFKGLEWWNNEEKEWSEDITKLKEITSI